MSKDDKNKYPKGSRQNPRVMPPSSQAGLQAIVNRRGGPVPPIKR